LWCWPIASTVAHVADLVISDTSVTVVLSAAERLESVHGDVSVPRSSVVGARQVPDGLAEVHGMLARGTMFPGVVMVGTWRESGSVTFAACHGHRPAVVVELAGQAYDRVIVTIEDPEETVERLSADAAGSAASDVGC